MNKVMLSCKKATELMEKQHIVRLTQVERVQLFMHTRMCDACSRYAKQSEFIDKAFGQDASLEAGNKHVSPKILSRAIKDKIINNLENK